MAEQNSPSTRSWPRDPAPRRSEALGAVDRRKMSINQTSRSERRSCFGQWFSQGAKRATRSSFPHRVRTGEVDPLIVKRSTLPQEEEKNGCGCLDYCAVGSCLRRQHPPLIDVLGSELYSTGQLCSATKGDLPREKVLHNLGDSQAAESVRRSITAPVANSASHRCTAASSACRRIQNHTRAGGRPNVQQSRSRSNLDAVATKSLAASMYHRRRSSSATGGRNCSRAGSPVRTIASAQPRTPP